MPFELERDGAELKAGLLDADEIRLVETLLGSSAGSAGTRIFDNADLRAWLIKGAVGVIARSILGSKARPVRAILFDKNPSTNWTLGWHQDRTIAVRAREFERGFDHWSTKSGVTHVEPPFSVIEKMITARVHLDEVDQFNAPLLISPGSHRLGRIPEHDLQPVIERCGSAACLANAGDVWIYRTAILHASERSRTASSRRVLHVDFSAEELPGKLAWMDVARAS